jgi:hypothetical protein
MDGFRHGRTARLPPAWRLDWDDVKRWVDGLQAGLQADRLSAWLMQQPGQKTYCSVY